MNFDAAGDTEILLARVREREAGAADELLSLHRERLKRMIRLRLDRRLQGRLDESDVVQEAYCDVARKLAQYVETPDAPFYLWVRKLALLKLAELHRRHLGTERRDAAQEVSIHRGGLPAATSASLAAQLLGKLTSPTQAALKMELRRQVQAALNAMDPVDREVLALRHFEQLSTNETALVLGLSKAGAGKRYLRAIDRLRTILAAVPDLEFDL